jgi:hypothetical protein
MDARRAARALLVGRARGVWGMAVNERVAFMDDSANHAATQDACRDHLTLEQTYAHRDSLFRYNPRRMTGQFA